MSDEQKAAQSALAKQLAQWDELEAAYKEEREKLANLHASHYHTWLRMPGTRRKRGGLSFWDMRQ